MFKRVNNQEIMEKELPEMNSIEFGDDNNAADVIAYLSKLAQKGIYVFRGYSKREELYPSIIRDETKYDENTLLVDLERYGGHYIQTNSPIEFMSYAQHFGLPTRLLDFTHNPFIALSFALYGQKGSRYKEPEDINFYYIRYADINKNIVVNTVPLEKLLYLRSLETNSIASKAIETIQRAERMMKEPDEYTPSDLSHVSNTLTKDEFISKIQRKAILFIDPNQSNERIIMQQGLFMFPYELEPRKHISIIEENTHIIKVHKKLEEGTSWIFR